MITLIRLKGKKLLELNECIHERDNYQCIVCGAYINLGEKWHHEPQGANKEDTEEKGLLLCYRHHNERHFGKNSRKIREKCEEYLRRKYEI